MIKFLYIIKIFVLKMSKENNINQIIFPIKKLQFEKIIDVYPLIPNLSVKVNENTFAFVCYSDERMTTYIKFVYINDKNELIINGEYRLDDNIIEDSAFNIRQIEVKNDNLIIIVKRYLIVEKIEIKDNNFYIFKNILKNKFDENLYKILSGNKVASYIGDILKIYHFSTNKIELLYSNKLNYTLLAQKQIKQEMKEIFIGVKPYDRLSNMIEIEERNEIIISFSRLLTFGEDDIDLTWCDYVIIIMNSKNFQIKSLLFDNLIEAEKFFYFGNNILYSFGFRSFYSLDLKCLKRELFLEENLTSIENHYYHFNIIPFLDRHKLLSFGYYRCGYYHNRDEYKHLCECNLSEKKLKEHKIDNIFESKYSIEYFPLKYKKDMILIFFEYELILYKINI